MWTVKLSRQASEFIERAQSKHRLQLDKAIEAIAEEPQSGKPLKGELKGYWSWRVGMFRMIYVIRQHEIVIEILRIMHRKEVYEKLRRL